MSKGGVRLFLDFDPLIKIETEDIVGSKILYHIQPYTEDITSLTQQIKEVFGIPTEIRLSVNGYTVLPYSTLGVLRDGDTVAVHPSCFQLQAAIAAHASAGDAPHSKRDHAALEGSPIVSPAAVKSNKSVTEHAKGKVVTAAGSLQIVARLKATKRARARSADADASNPGLPQPPALKAAAAAEDGPKSKKAKKSSAEIARSDQQQRKEEEQEDAQEPDDDTEESQHEGEGGGPVSKVPSRSARRKKFKRQMRREGKLPPARKLPPAKPSPAQRGENMLAQPPLENAMLPKRGEAWAAGDRDKQFMQNGHVFFSESDDEEAQHHASHRRAARAQEGAAPLAKRESENPIGQHLANGHAWNTSGSYQGSGASHQAEAKHQEEVGRGQEGVDEVMEEEEIDFEGLLRPEPWPVQGDIIAYRLLHIGADWTPQVSEWRRGRVAGFDEFSQQVTVEPWPDSRAHPEMGPNHQASETNGEAIEDEDEEEELPPSDYDSDGVLVTYLASFQDLRLIRREHSSAAEEAGAADTGLTEEGQQAANAPTAAAAQQPPPAPQRTMHAKGVPSSGAEPALSTISADAAMPHTPVTPAMAALPNLGPPRPASAATPSLSDWAEIQQQLKRRRAELATVHLDGSPAHPRRSPPGWAVRQREEQSQKSGTPQAAMLGTQNGGSSETGALQSAGMPHVQPAPGQNGARAAAAAAGEGGTPHGQQSSGIAIFNGVGGQAQNSPVPGSAVMTPGASKPQPGVRANAVGPLLARLRRESAQLGS